MDRFIVFKLCQILLNLLYLKSNMDRFIDFEKNQIFRPDFI